MESDKDYLNKFYSVLSDSNQITLDNNMATTSSDSRSENYPFSSFLYTDNPTFAENDDDDNNNDMVDTEGTHGLQREFTNENNENVINNVGNNLLHNIDVNVESAFGNDILENNDYLNIENRDESNVNVSDNVSDNAENTRNIFKYLNENNQSATLNDPQNEKNNDDSKKYMYRLITYLMKTNSVAKAVFEEIEIDNFDINQISKFTKIIMNANKIINTDNMSKCQLTMIYNTLHGVMSTVIDEIPHLKGILNILNITLKSQYDMCLKNDYQSSQLHYLAQYGNLSENLEKVENVNTSTRSKDFFENLLVPVSLIFGQFVVEYYVKLYAKEREIKLQINENKNNEINQDNFVKKKLKT